jgi:hypothetical protein
MNHRQVSQVHALEQSDALPKGIGSEARVRAVNHVGSQVNELRRIFLAVSFKLFSQFQIQTFVGLSKQLPWQDILISHLGELLIVVSSEKQHGLCLWHGVGSSHFSVLQLH